MNKSTHNHQKSQSYTAQDIQEWLINNIALLLGIERSEIDIYQPLESYGLDSAQGMILASKAEKMLGFKLSLIYLWYYPTIAELAERLAEDLADSKSEVFQL